MKNHIYLIFCALIISTQLVVAQPCSNTEASVVINIQTDNWGYETAWFLQSPTSGAVYAGVNYDVYDSNTLYETEICVPLDECIEFLMYDSYGDGIFEPGGYTITVDGVEVGSNDAFGFFDYVSFNCDPGNNCTEAIPISEGEYVTDGIDNTWYLFTADSTGSYLLTSCYDDNICDTKIWVYDECDYQQISEDNTGTIFYNDNSLSCGDLAELFAYIAEGEQYYIRIGDADDNCSSATPIHWSISYDGPVSGCTDPNSCNYNPLATVDDGSCLPFGDPDCPDGPDLLLRQDVLESSIYLTTLEADDECLVNEGCLTGTGLRDIIRFTTHIQNIGEQDYFIGDPTNNPDQFTYDNCHAHYHYDGYAEYLLYDEEGTVLPIGFKNGFCVLDLECDNGGTAQYGCSYMGISTGCGDIYSASLDCQWVDVTDVPDGDYHFVTRVNWDNAPDALGRVEKDTLNNWGQVCINLDRSTGELVMTLQEGCEPFVDCNGVQYGSAQPDCTGECGGTTLMGDLNANGLQEMFDAESYVANIIGDDIVATSCNDLNADGNISVYDAALLSGCLNYGSSHSHTGGGTHDHCSFPDGLLNTMDTVSLTIIGHDLTEQYIDIGMDNPTCEVVGYQFDVDGLFVTNIDNLVDPIVYPITPSGNNSGMVIGLSYEDSTIVKSTGFEPLCRIYFSEIMANEVCLNEIIDIVNSDYQQTITRIVDGCITLVGTENILSDFQVSVEPNPFTNFTTITFENPDNQSFQLDITDAQGRLVRTYTDQQGTNIRINRAGLAAGIYLYRLSGEKGMATGKLIVE